MRYYAHSLREKDACEWQSLRAHLEETAELAGEFAVVFGCIDWASLCALLHDVGKYAKAFQQRLTGARKRVDHSLAGALEALRLFGTSRSQQALGRIAAHIISGHHTGLADGLSSNRSVGTTLSERLEHANMPDYSAWVEEIVLPAIPPPPDFFMGKGREDLAFAIFFWTRMIFSCVVDADFLNTEAFLQPDKAIFRGCFPELEELRPVLDRHLADKMQRCLAGRVNARRAEVLEGCRRAALWNPGLFSLTVPTGGGKTLSSLAFALDHACRHKLRRVIYVIPYISIIEQTADVFRKAFGPDLAHAVLEHHANAAEVEARSVEAADNTEDARTLAFENWDAPVVVTTAVQFFESLFASRSSRCRKLHNIAGSVVILDEAQTLPLRFLRPCVAAIKELTSTYRVSFVLCTATQPELGIKPWNRNGLENVREIVPDVSGLFAALERVKVKFIGEISMGELAGRLTEYEQVLCIVNTRKQARELCGLLHNRQAGGLYHLSTRMCPAHRREVLTKVKALLQDPSKPPVWLIATSLIEAGVDIDFPVVLSGHGRSGIYRAGRRPWQS
jgi:CRISPR-associated endonuclease Cas3-HD